MHPTAVLIDDVIVEEGAYIGPFAALRADFGGIHIHKMLMCRTVASFMASPNYVTVVEESAILGMARFCMVAVIRKNALIGMNSVDSG